MLIQLDPWRRDAACLHASPDIFHPPKGGTTRDAKEVCAACPVRHPCLAWSLDTKERFGVCGGMSERERHPLIQHLTATGQRAGDLTPDELDALAAEAVASLAADPDDQGDDEPTIVDPLPGGHHPRQPTLWPLESKTA